MKTLRTLSLLSLALLISVPAFAMETTNMAGYYSTVTAGAETKSESNPIDIDSLGSGEEDDANSENSGASNNTSDNTSDEPAISAQAPKPGFFARAFSSFTGAAKATGSAVGNSAKAVYNKTLKPFTQEQLDTRAKNNTEWADSIDNSSKAGAAKKWSAEQYAKTNRFFAKHSNVANGLYYTGLVAALAAVTYGVKKTYDWIKSKWSKKPVDEQLIVAANTALTEKKPCVAAAVENVDKALNSIDDDVRTQLLIDAMRIDDMVERLNEIEDKGLADSVKEAIQVKVEEFNIFVTEHLSSKSIPETSDVSADNNCDSCKK